MLYISPYMDRQFLSANFDGISNHIWELLILSWPFPSPAPIGIFLFLSGSHTRYLSALGFSTFWRKKKHEERHKENRRGTEILIISWINRTQLLFHNLAVDPLNSGILTCVHEFPPPACRWRR